MLNLTTKEKQLIMDSLVLYLPSVLPGTPESKNALSLYKKIKRNMVRIKPRSAKNKGREWQQEVASAISDITGVPYIQSDDTCEIHSREMGLSGVDIILRGRAKERFPYSVECKNCKSISLPAWIQQAESNADDDWMLFIKSPALTTKKIVVMPMEQFMDIMKGDKK